MARLTNDPFAGFATGDEVEVTIKGKLYTACTYENFEMSAPMYYLSGTHIPAALVQSVRRIEPEYEVDELYVSKEKHVYCRLPGDLWRHCKTGYEYADNMPTRPLRKLTIG